MLRRYGLHVRRLKIFVALYFLLLLSDAATGFQVSRPTGTARFYSRASTTLHAQAPPKLRLSFRSLQEVARKRINHCLPPIPPQEENDVRLKKQFRPKFIAREFLLGVRIMCLVHPFLMMASFLMHVIRVNVASSIAVASPISEVGGAASQFVNPSPMFESVSNAIVLQRIQTSFLSNFKVIFVSPVIEEIAFRGFCHVLGAGASQINLWGFVTFCRFLSPLLVLGMHVLYDIGSLLTILLEKSTFQAIFRKIALLVSKLILLPTKLAIVSILQQPRNKDERFRNNVAEAVTYTKNLRSEFTSSANVTSDTLANSTEQSLVGPFNHNLFISKAVSKKSGFSSESIAPIADLSVSRSARWFGAYNFGIVHMRLFLSDAAPVHTTGQILYLTRSFQKFVGTMLSSLLVESRLAIQRRTLWGAIGAHMVYNGITLVTPLSKFIPIWVVLCQPNSELSIEPWIVPLQVLLVFAIHTKLLWSIASYTRDLERRFQQKQIPPT